jgi:hypothetical protein
MGGPNRALFDVAISRRTGSCITSGSTSIFANVDRIVTGEKPARRKV